MAENKIRKVDSTKTNPSHVLPVGGSQSAGISYDAGRKGLIVNPDPDPALRLLLPETWVETFVLSGASPVTAANYGVVFIAPYGVEVVSVKARFSSAGGAAASVDLKKAASGTDTAAGTSVITAPIALTGAAHTNVAGVVSGTAATRKLAAGDALGLVNAGTLTALANLVVSVELKRTPTVA